MIQLQAPRVAEALLGRSRQLLRQLEIAGHVALEKAEAEEFAAELVDIARAIVLTTDGVATATQAGAEVIDFTYRRRLRAALATPGDGDVA